MKKALGWLAVAAVSAFTGLPAFAQALISAKSGLIHYVEGDVRLDGRAVEPKFGQFPQIQERGVLRTEAGRAEVLLSPGVFLRMAENTEIRMISNRITDTRLDLVAGVALIECAEILKGNLLTINVGDATIAIRRDGLYRLDADAAELRVYDGQAAVEQGGQMLTVKRGQALALGGSRVARRFDTKTGDALFRWSKRRAEYIAMANIASAKSLYDSGSGWRTSGWYWNPYFGMFTYIPYRGIYSSPFGWRFFSPREVYVIYEPPRAPAMAAWDPTPRYNANLGYATVGRTPAGTSGTMASSAPPTAASSAPSAPIPRESGSAGGRPR